ncbi:regulatory protein ToxS [Vibrio hannami]|uniref:regulatory protein ToxS n=1 Tax=Vibrio hannami TaxID=2717094 RepID=UPI00240F1F49|nr:regulatory protein ToxS [Vibrio hannami]MDG3088719.1 regulatory protein ToxS [Vibrio hannami]
MKQKLAFGILALSVAFSAWLYWGSDVKVEQVLSSREWQSTMQTYLSEDVQHETQDRMGPLAKVSVNSNSKYLPNGTYIRVSYVELFNDDWTETKALTISETGTWELSDDYLLVNPTEFKDISPPNDGVFTDAHVKAVKELFIIDAEQSRRIDVVNGRTILLTSLNHGSRILFSN